VNGCGCSSAELLNEYRLPSPKLPSKMLIFGWSGTSAIDSHFNRSTQHTRQTSSPANRSLAFSVDARLVLEQSNSGVPASKPIDPYASGSTVSVNDWCSRSSLVAITEERSQLLAEALTAVEYGELVKPLLDLVDAGEMTLDSTLSRLSTNESEVWILPGSLGRVPGGPGRTRTYDQGIRFTPSFPAGADYLFTLKLPC